MTLGILGGTFDPPHLGHLGTAENALVSGQVTRVIFIPCYTHVFGKQPETFTHRVRMCELLVEGKADMVVSDVEKDIENPGRTLDLVHMLQRAHPGEPLRLIAGADIFLERTKWYRFDEVERLAPPLYVGRRGVAVEGLETLPAPMEVSSSEIRVALARGEATPGLTESVAAYIGQHGLYGV